MRKHILHFAFCLIPFLFLTGCQPKTQQTSTSSVATLPLATQHLEDSDNPVLQLMGESFAASDFIEGEVPREDVELILTAGSKAQSAKNAQPWYFSVILDDALTSQLLKAAQSGNVIIVLSGNPDIVTDTLAFDCGMAAQNIQLAAEALGYGARVYIQPVSEIEKNWRDKLQIPDNYIVQAAILIGHIDQNTDAATSATSRRALDETVSWITE